MPNEQEGLEILHRRFAGDSLMALATVEDGCPHVRTVNACCLDGAFYVVTYAKSNKMRHIQTQARVALCGDWFTAHGVGRDLGAMALPDNAALAAHLQQVFTWLANGHSDPADPDTHILQIRLCDGILFSHGTRYDLRFAPQE